MTNRTGRSSYRIRNRDYDWLVYLQNGEFCKLCGAKPEKPYGLRVDHIYDDHDNPEYDSPKNKRLICNFCDEEKQLQKRKNARVGVQNAASVSERLSVSISNRANNDAQTIIAEQERRATRSSPETKNEANEPIVWQWINDEWNRIEPTEGLIYPRCVPELVRRLRELTGSGSDAAVKRYINHKTSDGSDFWIHPDTKRIEPRVGAEYYQSPKVTIENLRNQLAKQAKEARNAETKAAELEKRTKELEQELKQSPITPGVGPP